MSLTAGASTVSLGGYAAFAPSTSSLPFSYSRAGSFSGSGSGSGYDAGPSGEKDRPRFDRAPPVPPPTSLSYARYAYYEMPSTSGEKQHPLLAAAWREPDKFRQCLSRAHDVRTENEELNGTHNAYGTFQMPDGSLYTGITRQGALFSRSGFWLEVKPGAREGQLRDKEGVVKREAISLIKGTRNAQSKFTVLEFIAVTFGLISMRATESNSFVCMDEKGRLYAAAPSDYSSDCIFVEEMLENYFNLYSSCTYGQFKRPWYMAIRRTGAPRNGLKTRKRRKAAHFLVVHHDLSPELRLFKPKSDQKEAEEAARAGQRPDLQGLIENTFKHRPNGDAVVEIDGGDQVHDPNERILTIKLEARVKEQRHRKRTRAERLAKEQKRREERKQELVKLREEEKEILRKKHHDWTVYVKALHEARDREKARKNLPFSFSNTVANRTQQSQQQQQLRSNNQTKIVGPVVQVNIIRNNGNREDGRASFSLVRPPYSPPSTVSPPVPVGSQPHRDMRRIETTRSPYTVHHRHSPIR